MILTDTAKNAMLQGLADELNKGANAVLSIYVGLEVAVEMPMTNPIEIDVSLGVLTFNTPQEVIATISGVPTSAKLTNGSGVLIADYTGAEIVLNKDKIYQGGYVGIQSLTVRI